MAKGPESLNQFEKDHIETIGAALYKRIFEAEPNDCRFSLKQHNHPQYDPYSSDHLIPEHFWTLTAKAEENKLDVTMIVRGQSWLQTEEMWFSMDGTKYTCNSDVLGQSQNLKKLRDAFKQKAAEIHDAELDAKIRKEKQREQRQQVTTDRKVDRLVSSIGEKTSLKNRKPKTVS